MSSTQTILLVILFIAIAGMAAYLFQQNAIEKQKQAAALAKAQEEAKQKAQQGNTPFLQTVHDVEAVALPVLQIIGMII